MSSKLTNKLSATLIAIGSLAAACSDPAELRSAGSSVVFGKSDFGELPKVPAGYETGDFKSLMSANGALPSAVAKKGATLKAGEDIKCAINAGASVSLIADVGSMFLVQAKKFGLGDECQNKGSAQFVEGYVEKDKLGPSGETTPQGDSANGEGVTEDNDNGEGITSGSASGEHVRGRQNNGESIAAGCSWVEQVSISSQRYGERDDNITKNLQAKLRSGIGNYKLEKAQHMPGETWRRGATEFALRVSTTATSFRVQAKNLDNGESMPAATVPATEVAAATAGTYEIPFTKFVTNPNQWHGASIEITVESLASGGAVNQACKHQIQLASPLVFDFSGKDIIDTKPVSSARVRFDLDADGFAEQTGWIHGDSAAFLALDLNNNGRIDDGRELFGTATQAKSGKLFDDGFKALAQYDSNGDGRIDESDAIYPKLSLWFDKNGNGQTDKGELVSVLDGGVKFVSLNYKKVSPRYAMQHLNDMVPNDVRYSANFWGSSKCGFEGCKVYDIFFGTLKSTTVAAK